VGGFFAWVSPVKPAAEAVEQLRAACRLAPNEAQYQYRLGLALNETGDLPGATDALKEAVRLDPDLGPAWYNLGLAFAGAGQTEQAIDALLRAESLDNTASARAPYALAKVLARVGRTEEARGAVRRVLQIDPNHAEAANLLRMLSN
jgi:tetratricopeptide (TPR) repeat protein